MKKAIVTVFLVLTFLMPGSVQAEKEIWWPPFDQSTSCYDNLLLVTMNKGFDGTGKDMVAYFKECFPNLPVLAVREETYRGLWNWEPPTDQEKQQYLNYVEEEKRYANVIPLYLLLLDIRDVDQMWQLAEEVAFSPLVKMARPVIRKRYDLLTDDTVFFKEDGSVITSADKKYYTYYVYFNPKVSGYGKDFSSYFAENYPSVKLLGIREESYYYDMWNQTEQEKYIYANWADATNYMGKGFRQVYGMILEEPLSKEIDEELLRDENIYGVVGNLEEFYIHQIPHTELVTFTCGDLDDDGQTTSQDALIILRSIVGLEQLNQYEHALADADFNFTVDSLDALEVLKISVGETEQPF